MNPGFGTHITGRWRWILGLAALSATTVYWLLMEPVREPSVLLSQKEIPGSPTLPLEPVPASAAPDPTRPEQGRDKVDLFAPRTWEPPPPPIASTPAPPPPPQAPPLPFKFFGRVVDADRPASFVLARGNEIITVRVGDRIEPAYLVEKFDGTLLHLVYLPLNIHQTIFVGTANE